MVETSDQCCKGLEKGGGTFWREKGGPGAPKSQIYSGDGLRYVFYCVFDINSIVNSIRKVHSVNIFRLRRATAAQRPSIVRKPLYIDVLANILDLRGGQGGPRFSGQK